MILQKYNLTSLIHNLTDHKPREIIKIGAPFESSFCNQRNFHFFFLKKITLHV